MMRTCHCIVVYLGIIAVCLGCRKPNQPPNILFITTDYTRGADLPVMGANFVKAPHIDRLCREGAVFTRHACVNPICMPARASWVTGMYPHSHSLWDNEAISIKKESWPFLLRDLQVSGYQTVGVGKMHFYPFDGDYNFDTRISLEGKDRSYRDDDYEAYLEQHGLSRKIIRNGSGRWKLPQGQDIYDWPFEEALHADGFVGKKAAEIIDSNAFASDKPWFFWVSFTGPHNPWNPPERSSNMYKGNPGLPTGDFLPGELKDKPIEYTRHRYGYGGNLFHRYDSLDTDDQLKLRHDLRAAHYGSLSFIDEQIGNILSALDEKKQLSNTFVIFSSDHGSALFDNEMLHKGAHFPNQSIVPFVVWHPKKVIPGKRTHFSSHVDILPTLLEIAGGQLHPAMEGHSLVPMFRDPSLQIDSFIVLESTLVTSIMTKEWLTGFHHISKEIDLYSLRDDPMCHHNLATNPAYQPVINKMRRDLVAWRRKLSPAKVISDDPLTWDDDLLGDPKEIDKYRQRYIQEYRALTLINERRPGIVGSLADNILKRIIYNDVE